MELLDCMSKPQLIKVGVAFAVALICFYYAVSCTYYAYGKTARNTVISVRIDDRKVDLFKSMEQAGISMDTEQREALVNIIRKKKAGFDMGD